MGASKPLLLWRGEPLVHYLARVLREGGAACVFLVIGPDETGSAIGLAVGDVSGVIIAVNAQPERGMLSSVQAGIAAMLASNSEPPAFVVCPCDLPKLEPAHVSAVLDKAAQSHPDAITVPVYQGKRGHPSAFGITLASEILLLDSTAFGLNEIVKRHPAHVVEIAAQSDAVLRDVDTPEEWRQLTTE